MEQINLTTLTTIELKALAYDQMLQLEICQRNLSNINQELLRRTTATAEINTPKPVINPLPDGSIQRI